MFASEMSENVRRVFVCIVLEFVYFIIADTQILWESQQTGFTQTNIFVLIAMSEDFEKSDIFRWWTISLSLSMRFIKHTFFQNVSTKKNKKKNCLSLHSFKKK
jgi:hypothetical protein